MSIQKISGTKFLGELPKGFDGRTTLHEFEDKIIVAHPDMPPHVIEKKGKISKLKFRKPPKHWRFRK